MREYINFDSEISQIALNKNKMFTYYNIICTFYRYTVMNIYNVLQILEYTQDKKLKNDLNIEINLQKCAQWQKFMND